MGYAIKENRICENCHKEFMCERRRKFPNGRFCSISCSGTLFKEGHRQLNTGRTYFKKGQKSLNKGGYKMSEDARRKISIANSGPRSYLWKGGITPVNKSIRNTLDYRLWRTAVFNRDNFTCIQCKARGVTLNADHIKPFSLFPELRLVIDNGRTLCEPCHRKTDKFLGKIKHYQKSI